jgi:hypothetical protein
MPQHLREHVSNGRHIPGIFVVDPDIAIAALAEQLTLIDGASFENEHQDEIRYLPLA